MDETLCALFAQALGLECFGPDDDFFDRGGQSAAATLLVARVNRAFGAALLVSDLFADPTPARLARRLGPLSPVRASGGRPAPAADRAAEPSSARFALTPSQEYAGGFDPRSQAGAFGERNVIVTTWRFTGTVDELALQDALDDLVVRHESLRTVVARDAEPPYQTVMPPSRVKLVVRYLALPTQRGYREFFGQQLAAAAGTEPFDVADLPLMRASLVRFAKEGGIIILVAHASALDAWSAQILMRDLAALYAVRRERVGEPDLPPVRQYRAYALEAVERARGGADPKELERWRERLAGARILGFAPCPPETVEAGRSPYGAYRFELGRETVGALRKLAGQTGSTPYMVLLAAFELLANERGAGQDLTVAAHGAGRGDPAYQDTVGLFENPLLIRTSLAGARTFRDVLARTRAACLETFDHELPFAEIRRAVPGPFEDAAGAAEIPAAFEMLESPLAGRAGRAADLGYAEEHAAPNPDDDGPDLPGGMRWVFALTPALCVATVRYRRAEFSLEAVARLVEGFVQILDRSVAQPDDAVALAEC